MLSIITCSINQVYINQLKENIKQTIGIAYEHLIFDNKDHNIGICQVYNDLAAKAQYSYVLFLHEDVLFETYGWGSILTADFDSDPKLGVIGIAGSNYKSKSFSGWYTGIEMFDSYNFVHNTNGKSKTNSTPKTDVKNLYPAVCIDGVFMACRKEVWNIFRFNETELKRFHFYDLDFSLRASEHFKIAVTLKITLEHITQGGDFGDKWITEAIHFHNYMKDKLPKPISISYKKNIEEKIMITWLDLLKNQKISFKNKLAWISKQNLPFRSTFLYPVLKFFLYKPLKLNLIHEALKRK